MFRIEETTTVEVYAHALDHGGQPIISGTEVSYEDAHDLVTYHADRAEEARAARSARFRALLSTREAGVFFFGYINQAAVASTALAAEVERSLAATETFVAEQAKRAQDAAFATYEAQS